MEFGYTARSFLHRIGLPKEDYYAYEKQGNLESLVVADGITRDPVKNLPDTDSIIGKTQFAILYFLNRDKTQAARLAARTFANEFAGKALKTEGGLKEKSEQARKQANSKIRVIGQELFDIEPDCKYPGEEYELRESAYLEEDLPGCVASTCLIKNERQAVFSNAGDTGIAIFRIGNNLEIPGLETIDKWYDKYNLMIAKTPGNLPLGEEHIPDFDWFNAEHRKYWRKHFRNNEVNLSFKTGENMTFGAYTGEPQVEQHEQGFEFELENNDFFILHSDGAEPLLYSEKFISRISRRLKNYQKGFHGLARRVKKTLQHGIPEQNLKVHAEATVLVYVPKRIYR